MEGCISTHFYFIQHYHLALSGSHLNGSDWTKSLISKILHITHSQWIYRNFTLHDKLCGYLHNKSLEDIKQTIEELVETPPEDIPEESKFLLEINYGDLTKSHIENQQYWIIALQAAITAGRRSAAADSRSRCIRHRINRRLPRLVSLRWKGKSAETACISLQTMLRLFQAMKQNPPSPPSSLESVLIQRPFSHSTAQISAFVSQIDILSSRRG